MKLLVAYGTKHGSTREVAEAIAERLREGEREVELRCAADVEDPTPYDGVVLRGALYFGRWHEDAARFLLRHRRELSELPVAVFGMGPKTAEAEDVAESRAQLDKALQKASEVEPCSRKRRATRSSRRSRSVSVASAFPTSLSDSSCLDHPVAAS